MGKANTSVNQWLRDNHRFASLYNGYVFGGRQIIRPEELEDLDRETDILVTDKAGKTKGGKDKGCGKAQGYCETLEEHGESGDPGLRIPG